MYNIMIRTAYPNELLHSGIKGQKWGVRRFQNPDGSLTPEGKRRYYKSYAYKIDTAIEKRQKEGGMTDRSAALAAISDMSISNAVKTVGRYALSNVGGAALAVGAAAAGTALESVALLGVASVAPIVGMGVGIGLTAKGIYNAAQLSKAYNHYKYQDDKRVKTVNMT